LRDFIRSIAPTDSDLLLEKGNTLLSAHKAAQAEQTFRKALETTPGNTGCLLGLSKSLLQQGKGQESLQILTDFPPSREYSSAQNLLPLAQALVNHAKFPDEFENDPLDASFKNALRLVVRGNFEAALDGLLDILRENKRYRDGKARLVILGLLETLGNESPIAQEYRKELATVLF
jgi:putative thioredoxin